MSPVIPRPLSLWPEEWYPFLHRKRPSLFLSFLLNPVSYFPLYILRKAQVADLLHTSQPASLQLESV